MTTYCEVQVKREWDHYCPRLGERNLFFYLALTEDLLRACAYNTTKIVILKNIIVNIGD